MTRIREAILVEGRYDVNTVRQIVDTIVLESGGFRIFNDKEQLKLLRRIAVTRGLIVLTDSDGAGFVIRNYLKGALPAGSIKQAYIPDIPGKERRKRHGSKEGKLGVEGMRPEIILEELRRACDALGGRPLPQGDAGYQILAFDCMPLQFIFWDGDDEFPAQANILFDADITDFLHEETVVCVGDELFRRLGEESGLREIRRPFGDR